MNVQRRDFLLLVTLAAATATPAVGQVVAPAIGAANTISIPDFSGMWGNFYGPGFELPPSGPGPVVNKSRTRQVLGDDDQPLPATANVLVSDPNQLVGDYTNPILKPQAAEIVKKHGEIELSGSPAPNPTNQCWPSGVPYVFWNVGMQMFQQADRITILYSYDHEFRQVRMNQPHPLRVTPSWYGDSVGHYEGDTLVIDTVGVKIGPFSMVDRYGTPYTQALHVVERYRLIDYEAAKEAFERNAKENYRFPSVNDSGLIVDPNFRGKHLQLQLTVEDEGVFTTPWSATVTYRRASGDWPEWTCVENPHEILRRAAVPTADKPDF